MSTERYTDYLAVRLPTGLKQKFVKKAQKYGDRSDVHRELILAFVEGRVTIKPNQEQQFTKLYEEHSK